MSLVEHTAVVGYFAALILGTCPLGSKALAAELVGASPFCKVFATGIGECSFDKLSDCETTVRDSTESCLPRKSAVSWKKPENIKKSISVSPYNFGAYLLPPSMAAAAVGGDKLKRGVIYISKPMKVVQKLPDGYLITNYEESGLAYVRTKRTLTPETPVCFVLKYIGDHRYTAIDGFTRSIPSMQIYSGKERLRTPCSQTPGIGVEVP